ncbi:hypothetical protein [Alkalicoccus urumqiensis]|nr:hypothetical protein [Alkalicoccus urumqiensis]
MERGAQNTFPEKEQAGKDGFSQGVTLFYKNADQGWRLLDQDEAAADHDS